MIPLWKLFDERAVPWKRTERRSCFLMYSYQAEHKEPGAMVFEAFLRLEQKLTTSSLDLEANGLDDVWQNIACHWLGHQPNGSSLLHICQAILVQLATSVNMSFAGPFRPFPK